MSHLKGGTSLTRNSFKVTMLEGLLGVTQAKRGLQLPHVLLSLDLCHTPHIDREHRKTQISEAKAEATMQSPQGYTSIDGVLPTSGICKLQTLIQGAVTEYCLYSTVPAFSARTTKAAVLVRSRSLSAK